MAIVDLYSGELTITWGDEEAVYLVSFGNSLTFSLPPEDFVKFVKELNKAAAKFVELEKKELEKNV